MPQSRPMLANIYFWPLLTAHLYYNKIVSVEISKVSKN